VGRRALRPLAFFGVGEVAATDNRLYLDVNRLARSTPWAHSFMTAYYERVLSPVGAGLLVLAGLLLAGWLSARRSPGNVAALVWSAVGAVVSFGIAQVLVQVFKRPRPYTVLHHVTLLVPKAAAGSYALPNSHAAIAGAVLFGFALARRWRLGALALLATLLLLFSGVYVGTNYPSDVAAGAGLGALFVVVLWPLGNWLLTPAMEGLAAGPFGWLVASRAAARRTGRQLVLQGPTTRLPTAKAMDALRHASEAARNVPNMPPAVQTTSVRTTAVRTTKLPGGDPPVTGEAS